MKVIYKGKQQDNFTIENFRKKLLSVPGSCILEELHGEGAFKIKFFLSDELVTAEYYYEVQSRQVNVTFFGNEKNFRKVSKLLL